MAEKLMKYADAVKKFDPVIGLETHVELSTTTKLFGSPPKWTSAGQNSFVVVDSSTWVSRPMTYVCSSESS